MLKWFYPGMYIKRWLCLAILGGGLLCIGLTLILYSCFSVPFFIFDISGLKQPLLPGILTFTLGIVLMVYGLWRAMHSVINTILPRDDKLVDVIYHQRRLKKGPKVVVIGGGTGIPVLLRGIKAYTDNLSAIITVADDGGSSGRLRGDLGILPPGDIRNCLVALADREPLMEELLQYRFPIGELKGHNMGNLLLAALCDINNGSFDQAVHGLSRVLAVRGQVFPATLSDVCLCAEMEDGSVVCGESKITASLNKIKKVYLSPEDCPASQDALQAIAEAEMIVMGPGSLYTSIIPCLMAKGVSEALKSSSAAKVYVCNVMTQPGETDGYTASQHLRAILEHAGEIVDYMVVNEQTIPPRVVERYNREGAMPVEADIAGIIDFGVIPITSALLERSEVMRHDPRRLARLLMHTIYDNRRYGERVTYLNNYRHGGNHYKDKASY